MTRPLSDVAVRLLRHIADGVATGRPVHEYGADGRRITALGNRDLVELRRECDDCTAAWRAGLPGREPTRGRKPPRSVTWWHWHPTEEGLAYLAALDAATGHEGAPPTTLDPVTPTTEEPTA